MSDTGITRSTLTSRIAFSGIDAISASLGSCAIANPLPSVMAMVKSVIGLLKGNPFTRARYMELLKMLYDIFMMARREGLVSLDQHVEKPHESKFFQNYPGFTSNHHAMAFLSDTMKIIMIPSQKFGIDMPDSAKMFAP